MASPVEGNTASPPCSLELTLRAHPNAAPTGCFEPTPFDTDGTVRVKLSKPISRTRPPPGPPSPPLASDAPYEAQLEFALTELARDLSISGELVFPWDGARWESETAVWNRSAHAAQPAFVLLCAKARDVLLAVRLLRRFGLDFTVAGGRHTIYARSQHAVMLSLGGLRSVVVDLPRGLAVAEGGCRNGDLDEALAPFNLGTPVGTNQDTGIGGLTLGGGIGWLSRAHGLTSDNVTEIQLVTTDGRLVTASADENPELFWGACGAGVNFGIVVRFTYRVHPVGEADPRHPMFGHIVLGQTLYPQAQLPALANFLDAQLKNELKDKLDVSPGLVLAHGPGGHKMAILSQKIAHTRARH